MDTKLIMNINVKVRKERRKKEIEFKKVFFLLFLRLKKRHTQNKKFNSQILFKFNKKSIEKSLDLA